MKNKRVGLMVAIFGILMLTFGLTYSFVSLSKVGKNNNILVAGDIYMHYNETNVLTLDNAVPRKDYDPNSYFEFTIDGKNEYTKKDIWYDITLTYGDVVDGKKTRINDDLLKFRLVENRSGEEKVLFDNKSFQTINNKRIWVDKIEKDTREEIKITYKLYMWLGEETSVGNLETNDYKQDEWNNDVYASIKVNVSGDFVEKTLDNKTMIEELKEKAYNNGEMIAIDNDSNKCESMSSCEAREYRYSGVKANNYVELTDNEEKGELWRIIGVFKEDGEEYVKLVKNEVLTSKKISKNFIIDGENYQLLESEGQNLVCFQGCGREVIDWTQAGLQYYLNNEYDTDKVNKGYLSYLSEDTKNMLREKTTYYLGNVSRTSDTVKLYEEERGNVVCDESVREYSNNNNCNVWYGNQATWEGTVGLLYPSDFGFSLDSKYWNNTGLIYAANSYFGEPFGKMDINVVNTSWLMQGKEANLHKSLISLDAYHLHWHLVIYENKHGLTIWDRNAVDCVNPTIALKSNVRIVSGNGRETNPYKLALS